MVRSVHWSILSLCSHFPFNLECDLQSTWKKTMDANLFSSSPSSPFSLILLFIISLIITIPQNSSSFNGFSSCNINQISCGNLTNVGFPFWGNSRPDGCGYPHLRLECERNITTIDIMNVKYQVLDLNLSTQILKIARSDLLAGSCASTELPTVLDPTLFEYAPGYGNINVFYDCSSGTFTLCSSSGNNFNSTETRSEQNESCSSHRIGGSETQNCNRSSFQVVSQKSGSSCSSSLTIGVSKSYDDPDKGNYSRTQEALREGFEVKYKVDTEFCSGCSGSGGVCGYGLESMKPACYCTNQVSVLDTCLPSSPKLTSEPSFNRNLAIAIVVGIIILSVVFIFICCKRECILMAIFWSKDGREDVDALLKDESFAPKKYSYSDIKRMTNSLSEKIGKGGFGTVYKGKLPNGRLVAVKILSKSKDKGQGFVNEVRIGKTNHVNIISLLGFCCERTKRVLVYEYMPNGSLDNFIPKELESSNRNCQLEWNKLNEIAVGIARGLEYLHKYCDTTILHFDIKPQNILLDEDFCPKISDFGLSKLSQKKETDVPVKNPGGTPGFIAPEAIFRRLGEVSHKYDVYSYGMLVIDMVGGRNNVGPKVSDISSEMYFPDSIYQDLELDKDLRILETKTEEEKQIARKMVIVSFWCTQRNPSDRPAMSKVIDMLEGDLQSLQIPPKPDWSSPARTPQQSTSLYTAQGSFLS